MGMGIGGSRLGLALLAATGALALTGCGGDEGGGESTTAVPEDLSEVRGCIDDEGLEITGDELSTNSTLVDSVPVSGGDGVIYAVEFTDGPAAESFAKGTDGMAVNEQFVVFDPSPESLAPEFDTLAGCIGA